jgi:hypothetical protein
MHTGSQKTEHFAHIAQSFNLLHLPPTHAIKVNCVRYISDRSEHKLAPGCSVPNYEFNLICIITKKIVDLFLNFCIF